MMEARNLPVYEHRKEILDALENNQVIVVESPTGSGKTTQIPLILKEAGYADFGTIGITQPRRIATLGVCAYIKNQIKGDGLPENYCAYKMRFYDTTDTTTRIKILTDGMLLQEIKADSMLSKYSVIMVDEAHERSLNIDFILGLLKQILASRKDLKVIISSATLNTKAFARYFRNQETQELAPIISIQAKVFDVQLKYYPLTSRGDTDEISHAVCQILNQILKRFKASGYVENEDTLVFLPGEFDIKMCMQQIYYECNHEHLQIYPLYGRMNKEEQEQVFEATENGKMKVVLATNIAETSLTIEGIKVVIDSGLAKINYYNQQDFTSSLILRPISKSSAQQRKGRAGRTSNGVCYRLFSKEDFDSRPLWSQEEILRTDLSEVVLRMVDLGIYEFERFPYITRPDSKALASGERTLRLIDAIDESRHLTKTGEIMVKYPLLPRHSRCIVHAMKYCPRVIGPVLTCISFLSCKTPFILPPGEEDMARAAHKRFSSPYGDFVSYFQLYRKYESLLTSRKKEEFCKENYLDVQSMDEILHVRNQLKDITAEIGFPVSEYEGRIDDEFSHDLLLCLCSGLIQYVCTKKKSSIYRTLTADEIFIHPGSAWFRDPPSYLLAGEIVLTTKLYARTVSPIRREWILELSKELYDKIRRMEKSTERASKEDDFSRTPSRKKDDASSKFTRIYGFSFPIVTETGKKAKEVTVIPSSDLPALARAYKKSSRHPKSINATVMFNGGYVHFGDKLYDIISLNGRVRFDESNYLSRPCALVFYQNTYNDLIPYLSQIMMLSPMKDERKLGFVELIISGKGVFFHVNRNFSEALNNSAYSLLVISEECKDNAFRDAYNRIVKMLD